MNALSRYQGVLIALLLVPLLAGWFAPGSSLGVALGEPYQEDFWLVWVLCLLLLSVPMIFLELALARRQKLTALAALPVLTREADAATAWRGLGWLGVVVMLLAAGGLSYRGSMVFQGLSAAVGGLWLGGSQGTAVSAILVILMAALTVAVSFAPRLLVLLVGAVLAIVAMIVAQVDHGVHGWHWTSSSLAEWTQAVTLALVAAGLGLGLYWQSAISQVEAATSGTRPVQQFFWILIAMALGGLSFAFAQGQWPPLALALFALASVCGGGYLINQGRAQMKARQVKTGVEWLLILGLMLVWLLTWAPLIALLAILGLVLAAGYSIFAGWHMKISHLRKALELPNEGLYNLWRIIIRLVIPVAAGIAIVEWVWLLIQLVD